MKQERMLRVIGQIDERYIAEYMECEQPHRVMIFPKGRRLMLAAAIAALMILLMGCAWAMLHLEDFQIDHKNLTQYVYDVNGQGLGYQDIPHSVLATGGIKGSPNYQAAAEWYAFLQEFDPDNAIQNEYYNNPNRQKFPEIYDDYWPYDQKMVDKLDELAAKYNLKLLGSVQQFQEAEDFWDALGTDILRSDAPIHLLFQNGHQYSCGNFGCIFEVNPPENETGWPEFIYGNLNLYRKDYLDTRFFLTQDGADTVEWNFPTPSGRDLLVISTPSDYGTTVLCDREEDAMVLVLSTLQKPQGDVLSTALTQEQIETILACIDFDLQIP